MNRLLDMILRRVSREGLPRFLAGDSWTWVVLALAAFLWQRARQSGPPVVSSVGLRPGERYLVTLREPE